MSSQMQEVVCRAHRQYAQTVVTEDQSQTIKYRALERTVKLEIQWPAGHADSLEPRCEEPGPGPGAINTALESHVVGLHLSQCPEWARAMPGLPQHLAAHGAKVSRISRGMRHTEQPTAEQALEQPVPSPQPMPSAPEESRARRYKCISRAALTKGKEGPKIDSETGRPANGEILGIINADEVLTVLDSDVQFSSAGVQRLFVRDRRGWVSVFAQDGTKLLAELSPIPVPATHTESTLVLGSSGAHMVSRDSSECDEGGAAPLDRSSLDVHLDPLGLGDGPTSEHSTPPPPEHGPGGEGSSGEREAEGRLSASVSTGRYRATFDFEPEQDTDLRLTRGGVVLLQSKTYEHWWEGANEADPSVIGLFPYNYVQPLMKVRASQQLPLGDEITVALPPALCPLAEDGSVQDGLTLQVLLPHGAEAGQEIEFPLPFDFDTSRIESESNSNSSGGAAAAAESVAQTAASTAHGTATRIGITKGGNQVPAGAKPPAVDRKTQRRRELEVEKALMYKKIEGELSKALSATDAKSLVRGTVV